jgi:hypothetical protein
MKTIRQTEESLCCSYITAVEVSARHNLSIDSIEHDYGVDGTFRLVENRGGRLHGSGFSVDFQAKASKVWSLDRDDLVYDSEAKAYNDLVEKARVLRCNPYFLIIFTLPSDRGNWGDITEDQLMLKGSAYMIQLCGAETENTATKRIRIPRGDILTPTSLTELLEGVKSRKVGA